MDFLKIRIIPVILQTVKQGQIPKDKKNGN